MDDRFWDFVNDNISAEPNGLRLKYHRKDTQDIDTDLAILQIECRRKFGKKLADTLSAYPHWIFPTTLSGEQSTSDLLAHFHASLVSQGDNIADLTAGLGIDARHIAQRAAYVTAVEIDKVKAEALEYNLGTHNVRVINEDCRAYLTACADDSFDTIFIDPARRCADGSRVYALSQCSPDITSSLQEMRRVARRLIVKMSPMLDISQTLRDLPGATHIMAIGTQTECKELLAVVDLRNLSQETVIEAVTLCAARGGMSSAISKISFTISEERALTTEVATAFPKVGEYIYDPFPAVMKAAPFNVIGWRYGVSKLHPNTHLYTSPSVIADFPGQSLEIERVIPFSSKYIKRLHKEMPRLNVSVRNFDISADALRNKLGVSDGGDRRLIGVTLADGSRHMLLTKSVS